MRMNERKRKSAIILSFLLSVALVFQMIPMEAYATSDEENEEDKEIEALVSYTGSGVCGPNLTWDLKDDVLTISGTGEMTSNPWWALMDNSSFCQTKVVIEEGVTSILKGAFESCSLTSVTLPSTLQKIGTNAFRGARLSDMQSLYIPKSVTEIGEGAFAYISVKEVTIANEEMTILPKGIFESCSNLTKATIPKTIEKIDVGAFQGDENLVTVNLTDNVSEIEEYAFSECLKLQINDWPDSLTFIGKMAFYSCDGLENVVLPDGLKEIGGGAFRGCYELEYVEIPDSVTEVHGEDGNSWTGEGYGVFQNCPKLLTAGPESSCDIYFHWTDIPSSAFAHCNMLKSVTIPSGATVGLSAFSSCESLEEVYFSSDEEIVLEGATFANCTALKTIEDFPAIKAFPESLFRDCTALEEIVIPESVESLGWGVFSGCTALKKVVIPASVQKFSDDVFKDCSKLTTAGPDSSCNIEYGWTDAIPDYAFSNSRIDRILFPDTLTTIGERSFEKCSMLKTVVLPDSLKVISSLAFWYCDKLSHIRLPEGLSEVRYGVFSNCPKLSQILFKGDCPLVDENRNTICNDVFLSDSLTAYYPGDNKTWQKKNSAGKSVRQSYGGEVTWKPMSPSEPVDPSKERSATINHQGTVSARFYLVDEDGMGIPEQTFSYVMHGNGKAYEYTAPDIMTDIDGGYVFTTPYYSNTSGKEEKDECYIEVTWTDADGKEKKETFTINVSVTPLTYTESWTIGLGADASFKGNNKESFSFGRGNSAEISLEHKKDGTEDLELSLTMDSEMTAELAKKINIAENALTSADIKVSKGKGKIGLQNVYATTIPNFDSNNENHQKMLSAYLALVLLLSSTDVLNAGMLKDTIYKDGYDAFEMTEQYIKVNLSAGAGISLQYTGTPLGDKNDVSFDSTLLNVKIAQMKANGSVSAGVSVDSEGNKTYSSGMKSEESFAFLSSTLANLLTGYSGVSIPIPGLEACYHKISDASASVTEEGIVSAKVCNYDSGRVAAIGYDELLVSHSYEAGENLSKQMLENYARLNLLYKGSNLPLDLATLQGIQEDILESKELVKHKEVEKMTNSRTWDPSIDISKNGSIGFSFNADHGWTAVTTTDTFGDGVTTLKADSSACVDEAKKDKDNDGLGTIFGTALKGLGSSLKDGVSYVVERFGDGVELGKARIKEKATQIEGWVIMITGRKLTDEADPLAVTSMSYKIVTLAAEAEDGTEVLEEGEKASTVGEAYLVETYEASDEDTGDENSVGEAVTDWQENTLDLTLSFTEEDLAEAGGSLSDEDKLAMYRYDEENGCYVYVGGTLDQDAMTVTAQITQPGEYVLALDGAAPSVTDIRVSDTYGNEPKIAATISDFSGIESIQLKLDGTEILSSEEISEYYDVRTSEFSYPVGEKLEAGTHTVSFIVFDKKGVQSEEISEEFYVSNAPEFERIYVQPDAINGMNVQIEASVTSEGEDAADVKAEITGHMKDGSETNFVKTLKNDDGTYTGTFRAGSGVIDYGVVIVATDSYGHETESKTYTCTMSNSGLVEYKTGNTTYQIGLRDGCIYGCETEDTSLFIPGEIYGVEITSIGVYAFYHLTDLSEIVLPDSIKEINKGAFAGCASLSKVTFGTKVEEIGYEAFEDCDNIKELVFPESLKNIEAYAFEWCNSLSKVTFGKNIESIGFEAFNGCSSDMEIYGYAGTAAERYARSCDITFVSIGAVTPHGKCGEDAQWIFENGILTVSGTGSIDEEGLRKFPWEIYTDDIYSVVIEDGITVIPKYAFYMYHSVTFTIPRSVTEIGDDGIRAYGDSTIIYGYPDTAASEYAEKTGIAFGSLEKIEVNFGEDNALIYTVDGDILTISGSGEIPDYVAYECPWYIFRKQIKNIIIMDGVTGIGDYAFYNMEKAFSIVIPDSVTEIGAYAVGYKDGYRYENGTWINGPELMRGFIAEGSSEVLKAYGESNQIAVIGADEKISLDDCEIYVDDVIYSGGESPAYVMILYRNLYLEEGTDYTVSFTNHDKVGTANAIISGLGKFEGTVERTYEITKQEQVLNAWNVDFVKSTSVQTGLVDLYHYGDGKISYQSDTDSVSIDEDGKITVAANYVGTAHIIVTAAETTQYQEATDWFTVEVKPQAPANLSLSNTSAGVSLKWSAVSGVNGYEVYRKSDGTGYRKIADISGAASTSYIDTSAKANGEKYEYLVYAYENETWSYDKEGVIYYVSPVSVSSVSNAAKGVSVNWSRNSLASGYRIYRSKNGGSYSLIKTIVGNSILTFNDTACANGGRYDYKVMAYKTSEGITGNSVLSSAKMTFCVIRPSIKSAKNSSSKKINLTWNKNTKANGYEIQYSTSKTFKGAKKVKITKASTTKKTLSKLKKKKTYYIRMRTYRKVSGVTYYSTWSAVKSVKVKK
ncbi:MAG: leucine-rich repeat protein [Lachnospiraceae bacterium]